MNMTCEVARDLAELYREKLVNKESAQEIRLHLKTCPNCRRYYKSLDKAEQHPFSVSYRAEDMSEMQERMYANLAKKMNQHRIMEIIGTSAAIGAGSIMLVVGLLMTSKSVRRP